MNKFTMKTYSDSYLYNNRISGKDPSSPDKRTNEAIKDFIITSHRIEDKYSDSFRGIIEEIKRQQRSSILLTVLLRKDVVLCIGNSELPRAFKVFDAKDPKSGKQPRVFIDVTGLIQYVNGYYYCKKIDSLCAYLADALVYLLYRNYPSRLVDNSNITMIATDCYVSMFIYIIDFLRVVGYSANKNKISYFIALFFLNNMMGKEIDQYTKNIACKVSGLTMSEAIPLNIYMEEDTFENIATFISFLNENFLKGFTLEIFIAKWMYQFGTGTQYGTELLTSFLVLLCNAYSGAYLVGQKQVERCCHANNLTKIWNAIERAGINSFDNRAYMNEADLAIYEVHDKNTELLAKAMKLRENKPEELLFTESDFSSKDIVVEKAKDNISYYKNARMERNVGKVAENAINMGIEVAIENCSNLVEGKESIYGEDAVMELCKVFGRELDDKSSYKLETKINNAVGKLRDMISECYDKETRQSISSTILELKSAQQYF